MGVYSIPLGDPPRRVAHRTAGDEEPAILPVKAPQTSLHFTGLAGSQNGAPTSEQLRQVFGVDGSLPPEPTGFVSAQAGVSAPALIDEVDLPVSVCRPHQPGQRIQNTDDVVLHGGLSTR